MTQVYQSTLKNRFNHIFPLYIYMIGCPLFVLFMVYAFGNKSIDNYFLIYILLVGPTIILPSIIIHINYLFVNYRGVVYVDNDIKQIKYCYKGEELVFKFNEIVHIDYYMTRILLSGRSGMFPWDVYHYCRISLENGKDIYLSSFLIQDIDLPIDSYKVVLHKVFYPFIWRGVCPDGALQRTKE